MASICRKRSQTRLSEHRAVGVRRLPQPLRQPAGPSRDYFAGKSELPEGFKALGDYFAIVPEGVAQYCGCQQCRALLDGGKDRKTGFFSGGEVSEYWFSFVNAVARELKPPGKYIGWCAQIACYPANYPPPYHRVDGIDWKKVAWERLGTPERMRELGDLIAQAEKRVVTETERQRVALWRESIWK